MPLASLSREALVAALAARRLDRTLTTALPVYDPLDPGIEDVIGATGLDPLDAPAAAPKPAPAAGKAKFAAIQNQEDAPPCSTCGSIMVRSGACYKCSNCGTTSGCA